MTFQPKGSMCAVCRHKQQDCSTIPFEMMKPIEVITATNTTIVKCSFFVKEKV